VAARGVLLPRLVITVFNSKNRLLNRGNFFLGGIIHIGFTENFIPGGRLENPPSIGVAEKLRAAAPFRVESFKQVPHLGMQCTFH